MPGRPDGVVIARTRISTYEASTRLRAQKRPHSVAPWWRGGGGIAQPTDRSPVYTTRHSLRWAVRSRDGDSEPSSSVQVDVKAEAEQFWRDLDTYLKQAEVAKGTAESDFGPPVASGSRSNLWFLT